MKDIASNFNLLMISETKIDNSFATFTEEEFCSVLEKIFWQNFG